MCQNSTDKTNSILPLLLGVIRLINGDINLDSDKYELNVTAMDDGRCCCENGKCPEFRYNVCYEMPNFLGCYNINNMENLFFR